MQNKSNTKKITRALACSMLIAGLSYGMVADAGAVVAASAMGPGVVSPSDCEVSAPNHASKLKRGADYTEHQPGTTGSLALTCAYAGSENFDNYTVTFIDSDGATSFDTNVIVRFNARNGATKASSGQISSTSSGTASEGLDIEQMTSAQGSGNNLEVNTGKIGYFTVIIRRAVDTESARFYGISTNKL